MKKKILFVYLLIIAVMFLTGTLTDYKEALHPNVNPSFKLIYFHNMKVVSVSILISFISFGIYDLIFLFTQFFMLGATVGTITNSYSWQIACVYLVPHGLFEIPAMILTGWIPIYFLYSLVMIISKKIKLEKFLKQLLMYFLLLAVLIFLSALVESFLTPIIIKTVDL